MDATWSDDTNTTIDPTSAVEGLYADANGWLPYPCEHAPCDTLRELPLTIKHRMDVVGCSPPPSGRV